MTELVSRILGKVMVSDDLKFDLRGSILGFEHLSEFYLLDMDNESTFKILQSKDDKDVCFILVDPFVLFAGYNPDIHDDDVASLSIENEVDLLLLAIVTIPNDDFKMMTANLLGPVVFNTRLHIAKQCIVTGEQYTTRHYVLAEQREGG